MCQPKLCKVERESYKLGTIIHVTVWGEDKAKLEAAADRAVRGGVDETESLFSVNLPKSEVSRINAAAKNNAAVEIFPVNNDVARLLAKAVDIAKETNGAFDPTIAPIVKLWGIGTSRARVPLDGELRAALRSVDYRRLRVSSERVMLKTAPSAAQSAPDEKTAIPIYRTVYQIFLGAPGAPRTSIDMGGIAKGHAADRTAALLRESGVKRALIDLGGNIYVIGASPKGGAWKIGIQHPFKPRGEYLGVVECEDISVVTSGPYERYFDKDGVRYHHIFDPKTGRPAKSDLASVTVISKVSADADALCTAFFVMGFDRTSAFLRNHRHLQAILVRNDGKIYLTETLKNKFKLSDTTMKLEILNGTGTEIL